MAKVLAGPFTETNSDNKPKLSSWTIHHGLNGTVDMGHRLLPPALHVQPSQPPRLTQRVITELGGPLY